MEENIKELVKECYSKTDLCNRLNYTPNGYGFRKVNTLIDTYNLDTSHFDSKRKSRKYNIIEKECPVCSEIFETKENHRDEKTTCSYSCSNTHFRSGENHPNWKEISDSKTKKYRDICFKHHDKICIICEEDKIVEVHHYDEDHENNHPTNLIPICSTHHKYYHSRYKHLVKNTIDEYQHNFYKKYFKR